MVLSIGQIRALIFLIISICGYFISPRLQDFSFSQYYLTVFIALLSLISYFIAKRKQNYLDFDTLFIVVSYIIGFFATFFYNQSYYLNLFFFDFNQLYLNSGAWLFSVGMNAYFLGSLMKKCRFSSLGYRNLYPTGFLNILNLLLMLLFVVTGGISYYKQEYSQNLIASSGDGIVTYLLLLINVISIISSLLELRNRYFFREYRISKLYIVSILLFLLVLLYAGNRTASMMLVLPIIGIYALWFRPIKLKVFALFFIVSVFAMWIIQNTRADEKLDFSFKTPALLALDLTIPSRTIYESMEYVDSYGYTYGKSMSLGLMGVIPGLAGVITDGKQGMSAYSSAELLTNYTFRKIQVSEQIGLGTTTVSDIYLSFGIIGVVILMSFLGYVVNYFALKAKGGYLYASVIYAALLANSVFLARASFTHPIRYVVWSVVGLWGYLSVLSTIVKYRRSHE